MPTVSPRAWLKRFLTSCKRIATLLVGRESAWERLPMRVPASVFGPGSRQPFTDYFEGRSGVEVRSIDDIVAFLQTCEYVSDRELFQATDVWQHPSGFEELRRGDCEDFALWTWRKLAELGIEAEFYVGRVIGGDRPETDRQHAWVVYSVAGTDFLFEPAARTPSRMIRQLSDVMAEYVPHFAANHRFETSAFAGCAWDSRQFLRGRASDGIDPRTRPCPQ